MASDQQEVSIGFLFENKSEFEVQLQVEGTMMKDGRNIFFTGASSQTESDDCNVDPEDDDLPDSTSDGAAYNGLLLSGDEMEALGHSGDHLFF